MKRNYCNITKVLCSIAIISLCLMLDSKSYKITLAEEAYNDYTYEYSDNKTSITIKEYNGSDSNVIIPSEINGLPVKYIYSGAFADNKTLISIEVPGTVIQIGNSWNTGAFANCTRLETVKLNQGSEDAYIGNDTFNNCPSLSSISVPSNYITIYSDAFSDCTKLTDFKWYKSTYSFANQTLGNNALSGCKSLKSATLPRNLKSIGDNAFCDCISLVSIIIPEGTDSIGAGAFRDSTSLTSVSIPSTIKQIGSSWNTGAFSGCLRLAEVTFAAGNIDAYIGCDTFYNCASLKSITIPGNYLTIYSSAFENCTKLETLIYEKSQYVFSNQIICDDAFLNCKSLKTVTLSTSLKEIEDNVFKNCVLLKKINIPEGVTKIGSGAFAYDQALESASIPSTIVEIGSSWNTGAFYNCTSLVKVNIAEGIDDSYLGDGTFESCLKLEAITIPGNYLTIYNDAFSDCLSLSAVTYKKSSYSFASQVIGDNAFSNCSSIKKITLSPTLKSIGAFAFENCSAIKSVEIYAGTESIGAGAFQNCSSLITVTLPNTLTTLGNTWNTGVFSGCTKLMTVTMPTGDLELFIGNDTFSNCLSLANVYIGENVFDGSSTEAFTDCNKKAILYSNNATAIGIAKAAGIKTSKSASGYINGKSLFGNVIINGTAKVGKKLSASMLAVAPIKADVSYEWTIDGKVVSTTSTYTIKKSDKGKKIKLTITGINDNKGSLSSTITVTK